MFYRTSCTRPTGTVGRCLRIIRRHRRHDSDQTIDRLLTELSGGVGGSFSEHRRQLAVCEAEFEARDDRLALVGIELGQRGLVPGETPLADGALQRRGTVARK